MRVLALDYGSARCGCALSDPTGTLATPIEPILRPTTRRGMGALRALVRERGVAMVVIGLPLTMAGGDSDQTREARDFARRVGEELAIEVELYDERLTTAQARRTGGSAPEDSRAAAHLLEAFLASRDASVP